MSAINQKLVPKLSQKLSPQQIQMIKLLELPTLQLEQRVKQEIEENPVLEEEQTSEEGSDDNMPKEVSMEEYLKEDDFPSYKSYVNNYSRDDKERQIILTEGSTLHDFLRDQLRFSAIHDDDLALAQYIVGNIDDDGYLRLDLQSISDDIAFSTGYEIPVEDLERGLKIVQSLEPPGIGARDLQECLSIQLARKGELSEPQRLARKIIDNHFQEFSKKHYEKLMSRLGINEDQFREAIEEIQRLTPKPGYIHNEGDSGGTPYIIPDFILNYQDGEFTLRLNSYNVPELKVNRKYADMIRQMSCNGSEADKEALKFVKSKIDSAKWFISAIKQRQDTLMRTMQAILDYQREYFVDGNESKLKPMILKDIADLTGLDVSTISRVVNSKYIQTHFGIILLKQLFSEAMRTDSGVEVSSYEIKNFLQQCIDREDKTRPLTDEALMEMLNAMGYHIARRTVAKYREMLDIPVARLRKEI